MISQGRLATDKRPSQNSVFCREVSTALALQLGVDRNSVDTAVQHPFFAASYGDLDITVYIVGNPLATPGAYISTDDVAGQMSDIIASSGKHTLVLFAHPDHLPRVYRSSIANFHGMVDATIFPAMIPYSLNWPVVSNGAIQLLPFPLVSIEKAMVFRRAQDK